MPGSKCGDRSAWNGIWLCAALLLLSLLPVSCKKPQTGTYFLRSYGSWTLGEARRCLFAKGVEDAPCFTPEQLENGAKGVEQHGYLVVATFDKPVGDSSATCRLDSYSQAWCHVP